VGYVRGDAGAAEGSGDAGGVEGEGAVDGAELRLQRLRRAGHVRVERHVRRPGRDRGRVRATPADAQGGRGARPRPREGGRAAAAGGRHRRGRSKLVNQPTSRPPARFALADYPCGRFARVVVCGGLPIEMGPSRADLDGPGSVL
jgi:hypothetical protein